MLNVIFSPYLSLSFFPLSSLYFDLVILLAWFTQIISIYTLSLNSIYPSPIPSTAHVFLFSCILSPFNRSLELKNVVKMTKNREVNGTSCVNENSNIINYSKVTIIDYWLLNTCFNLTCRNQQMKKGTKKRKLIHSSPCSTLEDIRNFLESSNVHLQSIFNIYANCKHLIVRQSKETSDLHSGLKHIDACLKELNEMLASKFNNDHVCFLIFPLFSYQKLFWMVFF